jgi:hypothetical protein
VNHDSCTTKILVALLTCLAVEGSVFVEDSSMRVHNSMTGIFFFEPIFLSTSQSVPVYVQASTSCTGCPSLALWDPDHTQTMFRPLSSVEAALCPLASARLCSGMLLPNFRVGQA